MTKAENLCREICEMEADLGDRRANLRKKRSELHRLLKRDGVQAVNQETLGLVQPAKEASGG